MTHPERSPWLFPVRFTVPLGLLLAAVSCTRPPATQTETTPAAPLASRQQLTPDNAVFVYVDYLSGLDDYLTTVPGPQFRNNVKAFLELHQVFPSLPVAVLGDEGPYTGRFYPEVREIAGDARYFGRTTPSGYTPDFAEWLGETGRKKVIIGGISIDNCTLHTSLALLRAGYDVHVVLDVSSTNNELAEEAAVARLRDAGAVVTTWITVGTELLADWQSPEGQRLMAVLQRRLQPSTVGEPIDPSADMNDRGAVADGSPGGAPEDAH